MLIPSDPSAAGWLVFLPASLPKLVLGAKAAPGAVAGDVVERAADRAGATLDAVARADEGLLLLLVPLVDARRAEMGAVLALAVVGADGLVGDLDVGPPGVLSVLDCEELLGELLHATSLSGAESFPDAAHQADGVDVVRCVDVLVGSVDPVVRAADADGQYGRHAKV